MNEIRKSVNDFAVYEEFTVKEIEEDKFHSKHCQSDFNKRMGYILKVSLINSNVTTRLLRFGCLDDIMSIEGHNIIAEILPYEEITERVENEVENENGGYLDFHLETIGYKERSLNETECALKLYDRNAGITYA